MANLELKEVRTRDGLYVVTYGHLKRPVDVQVLTFAANGLDTISPAEKGMLMAGIDKSPFTLDSMTSMDVFYDKRDGGKVVLARGMPISQLFLSDLVAAHRQGREFVVPEDMRCNVYDAIDTMLKKGSAFAANYGTLTTPANRLGEEGVTNFIYSDPSLGIAAKTFGDWLAEQRSYHFTVFDSEGYAARQLGPYITLLGLGSPKGDFSAGGEGKILAGVVGAFGVLIKKSTQGGEKVR
jgi:hypothetical protein